MAEIDVTLYITPNTLTDLNVWVFPNGENGGTINYTIGYFYNDGSSLMRDLVLDTGTRLFIESEGYVSQSITIGDGGQEGYEEYHIALVPETNPTSVLSDGTNTFDIKDKESRLKIERLESTKLNKPKDTAHTRIYTTEPEGETQIDLINVVYTNSTIPQTISGTNTFSGTINVPTQATSDNSTKAASTAYVKSNLSSYVPTSRTINGNALSSDISLTASDVGALPDTTVIPTKTSDLTNDSNFATTSQIPTNNNQLTNGAGYITGSDISNMVTTDTAQTITAVKTFSSSPVVPTPATSDNSTNAASTAFVKAQGYALDGNVVKLSGNQSIADTKTFTGYAVSQNAWQVKRTDFTKGDIPSSTRYFGLFSLEALPQDSSSTALQDKRLGIVEANIDTSGNTTLMFGAYRNKTNADGGGNNFQIRIKKLADNTGYAELSESPASGDSSTKIATTAFTKSVLSTSGNGLATYSQGESGYYKFTNGLMFQWGKIAAASGDTKTVTFPQPFTSSNYFATCCINRSGTTSNGYQYCTSKTTTSCLFTCGTTETFWMALGY